MILKYLFRYVFVSYYSFKFPDSCSKVLRGSWWTFDWIKPRFRNTVITLVPFSLREFFWNCFLSLNVVKCPFCLFLVWNADSICLYRSFKNEEGVCWIWSVQNNRVHKPTIFYSPQKVHTQKGKSKTKNQEKIAIMSSAIIPWHNTFWFNGIWKEAGGDK